MSLSKTDYNYIEYIRYELLKYKSKYFIGKLKVFHNFLKYLNIFSNIPLNILHKLVQNASH